MKLEMNSRKTFGELTNMWKLNNIFWSKQWIKKIKREFQKYFEMNEAKDTLYQNLWEIYSCKMPITRKINYLVFYLMTLEKGEQTKPKASWRKEINKHYSRNQWTWKEKNNRENQWNQKVVLWKVQWNWQTFS